MRSDLAIEQQACQTQIYGIYYPQLLHAQPSGLHMDDTQVYRSVLLDVTAGAESPNTVLSTPFRAAHTNEATEPLADSSLPSLNANRAEPTSRSKWNGVHLATNPELREKEISQEEHRFGLSGSRRSGENANLISCPGSSQPTKADQTEYRTSRSNRCHLIEKEQRPLLETMKDVTSLLHGLDPWQDLCDGGLNFRALQTRSPAKPSQIFLR